MLLSTTVRAEEGLLTTAIPDEVTQRLGLSAGTELFWVEDGQGGYRVYPGGEKTRKLLEAHDEVIAQYRDVFRDLSK